MSTPDAVPAAGPVFPEGTDEVLHESGRTRVVRRRTGGGSVIRKEARGGAGLHRLQRELGLLRRLAGVEGIPQPVDSELVGGAIVMRDDGSESLAQRTGGTALRPLLVVELGLALARTISALHHRGVLHGDINPNNIVVAGEPPKPVLIDFDLASTSLEERPGFAHESGVAGTLAYLAPERTGRTGWPVDQRADLYELGATLYELATGSPPFGSEEALELIHDHLTRTPDPPMVRHPGVPSGLSEIIMRLLAKEPDQRYQSADGVMHDLSRLREALLAGQEDSFPLGEYDFPLQLSTSSRPVGRDSEVSVLTGAFAGVARGENAAVLVTGAPGVGKTTLINELRPVVTASRGWFVAGKFDEHRRDREADAVWQALRALAQLLLAQPEAKLALERGDIRNQLGPNAGLLASVLPEFQVALDVEPEPVGGSESTERRLVRAAADLLRAVASKERPLVMVVDDLQWAGPTTVEVIDTVITERPEGLLLVGAYRPEEVDAVHPLTHRRSRWDRLGVSPTTLRLRNLPPADVASMLAELLRISPRRVRSLAEAVAQSTGGNPLDTIEFVNALRRDGLLTLHRDGWRWDPATVRRFVGRGDVRDLIVDRIRRLPERTQQLLRVMSCLSSQLEPGVLAIASGVDSEECESELEPALGDGLLVRESGPPELLKFRHDRVREAALAMLEGRAAGEQRRDIARRLAGRLELSATAAEQYLQAVDMIAEPAEQLLAADLFRSAAAGAKLTSPALAARFLGATRALLAQHRHAQATEATLVEVEREHYLVLVGLGRLPEADALFATISERDPDPAVITPVIVARISSLRARNLQREALVYGLDQLRRLGLLIPVGDALFAEIEQKVGEVVRWVAESSPEQDIRRPEATDPTIVAASILINELSLISFFAGDPIYPWLVTEAQRLWEEYGPNPPLVGALSQIAFLMIVGRQDYRTGHDGVRRVLAVSEARNWEPHTSLSRYLYALSAGHWFQSLMDTVEQAWQAREVTQYQGGPNVSLIFYGTLPPLLDCALHLDTFIAEADLAMLTATRLGDEQSASAYLGYRQLARALRGETSTPGSLSDSDVDMAAQLESVAAFPTGAAHAHTTLSVAAAVFHNVPDLLTHSQAAKALLPFAAATYTTVTIHFMRALALAEQARQLPVSQRQEALAEFDESREWLAARARDAPHNYGYMVGLLDAERHWLAGDRWAAAESFDKVIREVSRRQRIGHRALIAERAARFYLAEGMEHNGRSLLAQAAERYSEWGAAGKVAELERAYPFLRTPQAPRQDTYRSSGSVRFPSDAIDMLAVLDAARALSSATSLGRLRERLAEALGAMTGASHVQLLTWDETVRQWRLPRRDDTARGMVLDEDAAAVTEVPLSVVRYVQRTLEPLLVEDATEDDRFRDDPHLNQMRGCSLLAVPIVNRGTLRAILLLTKPGSRGAFTAERLDSVMLVAGQLAVSLENAAVYASLEEKVNQRTEALASANTRLEQLNQTDPLTGLANRRRLEEKLTGEWNRGASLRSPVGLAMVDIDHFKLFNDHYGHPAGDECLRRVATALAANARTSDIVARYGGEEFALVLPGADLDAARQIAERARLSVAALMEPNEPTPIGFVTVSLGVAAIIPTSERSADRLLEAADEALYEAKRSGRNRVAASRTPSIQVS